MQRVPTSVAPAIAVELLGFLFQPAGYCRHFPRLHNKVLEDTVLLPLEFEKNVRSFGRIARVRFITVSAKLESVE